MAERHTPAGLTALPPKPARDPHRPSAPSAAEAACGKGLPPCWPLAAEAACGEGTRRADKWPAGGRRKKGALGRGGAGFGGRAGRPQPKTALYSCGGQVFEKMT